MNLFVYDNTFGGLLTAVFDAYEQQITPDKIVSYTHQGALFGEKYEVVSDEQKAERVWQGLKKKSSNDVCQMIYRAYLSELPDIEMLIFKFLKQVFDSKINIATNLQNDSTLDLFNILKKVNREAHRILMFLRFQKTNDGTYYASFDPKYNVLPLTIKHFESRFADQKWIVYDTRRDFGFYYDLKETREINLQASNINTKTGKMNSDIMHQDEKLFQQLWQNYYDSINIKERKNLKVQMQFMPKRLWKYLPEKNRGS